MSVVFVPFMRPEHGTLSCSFIFNISPSLGSSLFVSCLVRDYVWQPEQILLHDIYFRKPFDLPFMSSGIMF